MSSHAEAVPDAVRSGRSPRSRKPVVAVTGAASGLGAAGRGPAGGQPGCRQGRRHRRPPRQTEGVTWRVLDVRDPALAARLGEGRHRRPPGARHRRSAATAGPRASSTSAAPRPCSRRRPRPAYAGWCWCTSAMVYGALADNPVPLRRGRAAARGARRRPALRPARDRAAGRPGAAHATPACRSPWCGRRPWSAPASTAC